MVNQYTGSTKSNLDVYFLCNTGLSNITESVKNSMEKFSHIMAVLSKNSNKMSVHYVPCSKLLLPALVYGCEVWHLNDSNMQKIQ